MSTLEFSVLDSRFGDATHDIGKVINNIIAHVKELQNAPAPFAEYGKPGATIVIPSGSYELRTQVVVDISFLKIMGHGHGFISSSIRFNSDTTNWHDIWPGGSRVVVKLTEGPAFVVKREGNPRISSVEFCNFMIDGLHFLGDVDAENSYKNGLTGIEVMSANDSFVFREMGFIYLEHGLVIHKADALTVDNCFIAECGNCVELKDCGQASKITNNLMGAGYNGYTIFAQNYGGLLISGNNIFPRGESMVHLETVARSLITGNRFHSFYPGMLRMLKGCNDNSVSSNHFYRDHEPWAPMFAYDNGLSLDYGLIVCEGNNNSFIANHVSACLSKSKVAGQKMVGLKLVRGSHNYVANNHFVLTSAHEQEVLENEACFEAQVGALLNTKDEYPCEAVMISLESEATNNVVLDSCQKEELFIASPLNKVRVLP